MTGWIVLLSLAILAHAYCLATDEDSIGTKRRAAEQRRAWKAREPYERSIPTRILDAWGHLK